MKKTLVYSIAIIVSCLMMQGCTNMYKTSFEEHDYIVTSSGGICHSESCSCKTNSVGTAVAPNAHVEGETLFLGAAPSKR